MDVGILVAEIAGTVLTLCALGYAVYQYNREVDRKKAEKALDLSKEFAEKIIPLSSIVTAVYLHIGFDKSVQSKIHGKSNIDFRYESLIEMLSDGEIKEIEDGYNLLHDPKTIIMGSSQSPSISVVSIEAKGAQDKAIGDRNTVARFFAQRRELLNILEWFSMQFTVKVADEECVYQSLHGTFCSLIELMYYDICEVNKNKTEASRLYVHIQKLYDLWNSRHSKKELEEKQIINKARNKTIVTKSMSR